MAGSSHGYTHQNAPFLSPSTGTPSKSDTGTPRTSSTALPRSQHASNSLGHVGHLTKQSIKYFCLGSVSLLPFFLPHTNSSRGAEDLNPPSLIFLISNLFFILPFFATLQYLQTGTTQREYSIWVFLYILFSFLQTHTGVLEVYASP